LAGRISAAAELARTENSHVSGLCQPRTQIVAQVGAHPPRKPVNRAAEARVGKVRTPEVLAGGSSTLAVASAWQASASCRSLAATLCHHTAPARDRDKPARVPPSHPR